MRKSLCRRRQLQSGTVDSVISGSPGIEQGRSRTRAAVEKENTVTKSGNGNWGAWHLLGMLCMKCRVELEGRKRVSRPLLFYIAEKFGARKEDRWRGDRGQQ